MVLLFICYSYYFLGFGFPFRFPITDVFVFLLFPFPLFSLLTTLTPLSSLVFLYGLPIGSSSSFFFDFGFFRVGSPLYTGFDFSIVSHETEDPPFATAFSFSVANQVLFGRDIISS